MLSLTSRYCVPHSTTHPTPLPRHHRSNNHSSAARASHPPRIQPLTMRLTSLSVALLALLVTVSLVAPRGEGAVATEVPSSFNVPQVDPSFNDHSYELYSVCTPAQGRDLVSNQTREAVKNRLVRWHNAIQATKQLQEFPPLQHEGSIEGAYHASCVADADFYRMVRAAQPRRQAPQQPSAAPPVADDRMMATPSRGGLAR